MNDCTCLASLIRFFWTYLSTWVSWSSLSLPWYPIHCVSSHSWVSFRFSYRSFHPDTVFSSISNTFPISTALYPLLNIRIAFIRSHFFLSLSDRCSVFSSRTSLSLNFSFIPSFSHDSHQKTHEISLLLSLDSILERVYLFRICFHASLIRGNSKSPRI